MIPGIERVAENSFDKAVKIAEAVDFSDGWRIYADARDIVPIGLAKLAMRDMMIVESQQRAREESFSLPKFLKKLIGAIGNW